MLLPIHVDQKSRIDWFQDFRKAVGHEQSSLSQSMLYTGPAIGRNWRVMSRNMKMFQQFELASVNAVTDLLTSEGSQPSTIVDLGVGTFKKSSGIIEALLAGERPGPMSYVALDLSTQILLDAVAECEEGIADLLRESGGRVYGVLANMDRAHEVLPTLAGLEAPYTFLLLGNTLGNIDDPVGMLRRIREAMTPSDLLVVELQMPSKTVASDSDIKKYCEATKFFYGGPFLAVGIRDTAFDVRLGTRDVHGEQVTCIECVFLERATTTHPCLLHDPVVVLRDQRVTVTLARRYTPESAEAMGRAAGFDTRVVVKESKTRQRFVYLVLRSVPIPATPSSVSVQNSTTTVPTHQQSVTVQLSPSAPKSGVDAYTPTFQVVRWSGQIFRFKPEQAETIQALWEAKCEGFSQVSNTEVARRVGLARTSFRLERSLEGHPAFERGLVKDNKKRGRARAWLIELSIQATQLNDL